jgi:hypothetical protein
LNKTLPWQQGQDHRESMAMAVPENTEKHISLVRPPESTGELREGQQEKLAMAEEKQYETTNA